MKRNKEEDNSSKDETMLSTNQNNNTSNNHNNNNHGNDANSGVAAGAVRTTGRVKKPKLVYDPSDNYISRGARNSLPPTINPALAASTATVAASPTAATAAVASAATIQHPTSPTAAALQQQQQQQTSPKGDETTPVAATPTVAATGEGSAASLEDSATEGAEQQQQRNVDTCSKCMKSEPKRGSGYKSNFLACKTCALKWHFNCLPTAFEILSNARKRFKCDKCRRCHVCSSAKRLGEKSELPNQLLMCCMCANVYHLDCHWPRLAQHQLSDGSWKCSSCDPNYNAADISPTTVLLPQAAASSSSSSSPPLPLRKSKVGRKKRATSDPAPANAKKLSKDEQEEQPAVEQINLEAAIEMTNSQAMLPVVESAASLAAPIDLDEMPAERENGVEAADEAECSEKEPIVQSWNVDQVVSYVEKFYPHESNIFKSQEIDGAALMVLTRQDIIDRFGLKLGPSLRIYQLVLSLQTSLDDVTLGWVE